jgi:hypothetical protein
MMTRSPEPRVPTGIMRAKKEDGSSTVPRDVFRAASSASGGMPSTPRIALPNDLSTTLRYLDNPELQRLLAAVMTEISRRSEGASTRNTGKGAAPVATVEASIKASNIDEIPEGKANLIRASFRAGLKPAAIARMFRIPPSLVNRIIGSTTKSKR